MKAIALTMLMIYYAGVAHAADVTLAWDPVPDPDLHHYTLYQAEKYEAITGPWHNVQEVPKTDTKTTVTVEDSKAFAWYVTATGTIKGESRPSNTVELYERKRIKSPTCLGITIP